MQGVEVGAASLLRAFRVCASVAYGPAEKFGDVRSRKSEATESPKA